jgi:hypothetical protein
MALIIYAYYIYGIKSLGTNSVDSPPWYVEDPPGLDF